MGNIVYIKSVAGEKNVRWPFIEQESSLFHFLWSNTSLQHQRSRFIDVAGYPTLSTVRTIMPRPLKHHDLQQRVSEVSPLYKHTLTPPCCHSTEQCTSAEYEQKNCSNIQTLKPSSVIGGMGKQEQDRKESAAIVEWPYRLSPWQGHQWTLGTHTITGTQSNLPNSPAWSVGEDYVAFFICLLDESYARLFLPVAHGLLEHGPLTTWNTHILHPTFTQSHVDCWAVRAAVQRICLPVKFPAMT